MIIRKLILPDVQNRIERSTIRKIVKFVVFFLNLGFGAMIKKPTSIAMFKHVIFLLLFCLINLNLGSLNSPRKSFNGVNYIPVDRAFVETTERNTDIFYHNNHIDQLWYGTNSWAVKFDLKNYTTVTDSLVLEKVNIYFPTDVGSFSLRIYTDELQPLKNLSIELNNIPVERGWNAVRLDPDDYITDTYFWIVIDYITNATDRFMAASAVGGEHSYYWVPEEESFDGHFANMAQNNSSTEFLVNLKGQLLFEGIDLELSSFVFGGNVEPGGSIHPVPTIRNNSNEHFSDRVSLAIDLINSAPAETNFRAFSFHVDLAPGQSQEYNLSEHNVLLPKDPCQYRVTVTLEHPEDMFTLNNVIQKRFNTFPSQLSTALVENFIRSDHESSKNILSDQEKFDGSILHLNYFFHYNDVPHFNIGATQRKDYYNLNGYPFTIINGQYTIAGYSDDYFDSFDQLIRSALPSATFIALVPRSDKTEINMTDMQLSLSFTLRNTSTYIFPATSNNLRLYVALTEKNVTDINSNSLIYLYMHPISPSLRIDERFELEWDLNLQTVETIQRPIDNQTLEHFQIIYWVQHYESKEIYYIHSFDLDEFTLNTEEMTVSPSSAEITVHPNPFTGQEKVYIDVKYLHHLGQVETEVDIYNIKGQLIRRVSDADSNEVYWDGLQADGSLASNGIYLLKIKSNYKTPLGIKSSHTQFKRLSVIR